MCRLEVSQLCWSTFWRRDCFMATASLSQVPQTAVVLFWCRKRKEMKRPCLLASIYWEAKYYTGLPVVFLMYLSMRTPSLLSVCVSLPLHVSVPVCLYLSLCACVLSACLCCVNCWAQMPFFYLCWQRKSLLEKSCLCGRYWKGQCLNDFCPWNGYACNQIKLYLHWSLIQLQVGHSTHQMKRESSLNDLPVLNVPAGKTLAENLAALPGLVDDLPTHILCFECWVFLQAKP